MTHPMPPAWARDTPQHLGEEQSERLRADAAAERLRVRGIAGLPVNREQARFELGSEERANLGSRPATRRWKLLSRHDDEIDRLNAKLADASARVQEAEAAVRDAPTEDAQSLASWIAGAERGKRPEATLPERTRERDAALLLVEAVQVELDRALERRLRHVEANRSKMLDDARSDVKAAQADLLELVSKLPELRGRLVVARATLLWTSSYPDPDPGFGSTHALALGLRKPVEETLQTSAQLPFDRVVAALERDAEALAEAFSTEQSDRLGVERTKTPLVEAMWDGDIDPAWKAQELERARAIAAYSVDPHRVALEASDLRPDPS